MWMNLLVCLVILGLPVHALAPWLFVLMRFVCGWFCFGWVLGFSRPVSLGFVETVFVESLILAQDERWRRA